MQIHHIDGRYLVYDVADLQTLREKHNMCGVLMGTLPQIAQQNVFLGLPQQLMPEEAAYLERHGFAEVIDDPSSHQAVLQSMTQLEITKHNDTVNEERKRRGEVYALAQETKRREQLESRGYTYTPSIHAAPIDVPTKTAFALTINAKVDVDERRYALYEYLHDLKYFLTPGLRFGAQFVAYPGDPLRFHSHFIASGYGYDEKIPVMGIVAGGRLGTGVKKAWLVGAQREGEVKCFTVEWAGM